MQMNETTTDHFLLPFVCNSEHDLDEYFKEKCRLLNSSASTLTEQDKIDLLNVGVDIRIKPQLFAKNPETLTKWPDVAKKLLRNYFEQKNLSNQIEQLNRPTSLDDLPNELLIKIFRHLPILQRVQIDKI